MFERRQSTATRQREAPVRWRGGRLSTYMRSDDEFRSLDRHGAIEFGRDDCATPTEGQWKLSETQWSDRCARETDASPSATGWRARRSMPYLGQAFTHVRPRNLLKSKCGTRLAIFDERRYRSCRVCRPPSSSGSRWDCCSERCRCPPWPALPQSSSPRRSIACSPCWVIPHSRATTRAGRADKLL